MIDIEFIAQYLMLRHANAAPNLIHPATADALSRLGQAGVLAASDRDELSGALSLFKTVLQATRIACAPGELPETMSSAFARQLPAMLGEADFARTGSKARPRPEIRPQGVCAADQRLRRAPDFRLKNSPRSFRDAAKRGSRIREKQEIADVLDFGFAPVSASKTRVTALRRAPGSDDREFISSLLARRFPPTVNTMRGMPPSLAHAASTSVSGTVFVSKSKLCSAAACSTSRMAPTMPFSGTLPMPLPIISMVEERTAEAGRVMLAPLELPTCTKRIGTPSGPALAPAISRRSALLPQR